MFSKILISRRKLLNNVDYLSSLTSSKICAMVKANAYGHGIKEMVEIIDKKVDYFGVSNENEALEIRQISDSGIIVFGACQDYEVLIKKHISFAIFSYFDAKKVINLAKKTKLLPKIHVCINSGMNRYGVKTIEEFEKIIEIMRKNNIKLEGLYTHFSSLTTDNYYTKKQHERFLEFASLLPKEWKTIKHIGGGNSLYTDMSADMYRVGLQLYGYGNEQVEPVMKVQSQIVDLQEVEKGEHVGYLCSYTATKNITVATVPLGYADGFPRKLSNNFNININGKEAKSVGNICMDAMMFDVSDISCKVGDKVCVFDNATKFAKMLNTSEYEVLTNLSHLRGKRIVY